MNGRYLDVPALGGRTLGAAAALRLGDLILREAPEIYLDKKAVDGDGKRVEVICKVYLRNELEELQEDVAAMVLAYLGSPEFQEHDLSDYYAPPRACGEPAVDAIDKVLDEVNKFYRDLDMLSFRQFVFAMLSNAHAYGSEVLLYPFTSKMAHSCDPNVMVVIDPVTRECCSYATRDITEDEPLCFSYLSELPVTPSSTLFGSAAARRAQLRRTKYFQCNCARCCSEAEIPVPTKLYKAYRGWLVENSVADMAVLNENDLLGESDCPKIERCLLDLGLALKALCAVPQRFGWGVCVSENLASEGAARLLAAAAGAETCPQALAFALGVLRPAFLEISSSLTKLPSNVGFASKDQFTADLRAATAHYRRLAARYHFVLDDNEPLSSYLVE